jgi:CRP-like cAMP-binding protein
MSFGRYEQPDSRHLGLLVLNGLVVRHMIFGQLGTNELVGPRDLMRPWARRRDASEVAHIDHEALVPVRLAVLDRTFVDRVRAWPEITTVLLDRASDRSDSQSLQSALRQARRVEDRVLVALWHFAGRWGQIGSEGRVIALPNVTGEILGRFVGARRQAVSTAITSLVRTGAVTRRADGTLVIPREPPKLDAIEPGRRATDRKPRLATIASTAG